MKETLQKQPEYLTIKNTRGQPTTLCYVQESRRYTLYAPTIKCCNDTSTDDNAYYI